MTEEEAFQKAIANVERNEQGDADLKKLLDELEELIPFDADAERRAKAKRIVDRHRRPGSTEPDGQLALPGIDPYAWEPLRLVSDNERHVIELEKAPVSFKQAEAERARSNAVKQQGHANRKTNEADGFARWIIAQATGGRPIKGLSFGLYVRETGLWRPAPAAPEPDDGGDES